MTALFLVLAVAWILAVRWALKQPPAYLADPQPRTWYDIDAHCRRYDRVRRSIGGGL